jgi:hypothetical protein
MVLKLYQYVSVDLAMSASGGAVRESRAVPQARIPGCFYDGAGEV